MKKEDCKSNTEWDYLGYKLYTKDNGYHQSMVINDWITTLITKINSINNMVLVKSKSLYVCNTIKVHPNLKPLINILVNSFGKMFTERYSIIFNHDIDEDVIFVYYRGDIEFIHLDDFEILTKRCVAQCSEEEILEYTKGTRGYIKILNYTNMEKEPTLGQKRVKADFNPAKNDLVDQIKNKSAELIDLIETMREVKFVQEPYLGKVPVAFSGEKQRLIELAQTDIETACMYAVKANFTN